MGDDYRGAGLNVKKTTEKRWMWRVFKIYCECLSNVMTVKGVREKLENFAILILHLRAWKFNYYVLSTTLSLVNLTSF